jgi:hypothetical protein
LGWVGWAGGVVFLAWFGLVFMTYLPSRVNLSSLPGSLFALLLLGRLVRCCCCRVILSLVALSESNGRQAGINNQ